MPGGPNSTTKVSSRVADWPPYLRLKYPSTIAYGFNVGSYEIGNSDVYY